MDHLARGSMKSAAKCANPCELQNTWSIEILNVNGGSAFQARATSDWGSVELWTKRHFLPLSFFSLRVLLVRVPERGAQLGLDFWVRPRLHGPGLLKYKIHTDWRLCFEEFFLRRYISSSGVFIVWSLLFLLSLVSCRIFLLCLRRIWYYEALIYLGVQLFFSEVL